ncbi:bifunctional metallophosphatase/5'-nucleotidase [Thalassobaculum litoreum]|uniref:5'-nucleotidase n=2 Tax=Thalassobaculum TaxID=526215 RepID=A0A8G2BKB2_9PROT|nr:5'-nucleotidase C-terminal domain-containing protein [Thalassobaculum litoreum]SDG20336.1 5'-nucleotidase [Thalassobaculum litoreum DSM 18839]
MFSFLRTFTFALVAVAALAGPAAAEPLKLVLLHLNDWDKMESAGKVASVIAAEKKAAEAEGAFVLVTFGGDLISPSLMSGIDKGAHMIELAEQVGIQYATLGNHEFDLGDEVLKARVAESDFTWISSNVTLDGNPFPGVEGPQIIDMNGYKIGLIGLTTPDTTFLASPGPGVAFADYTESATSAAGAVKELGADFVIVLSHGGESLERGLTRSVKDVDLVLGGHDHLARIVYDGRDMTASSGSQGEFIAKTVIVMDKVEKRGKMSLVWSPSFDLVATADVTPEPTVQAQVDEYTAALDRELGQVIGSSGVDLDTRRAAIRSQETTFGNLVADASREATGADIAIANGGGIRGDTLYPAGTQITRKMVLTELPFGNTTVKLEVTGKQVREALEHGVSGIEDGQGRFPQVSGMTYSFDASKPVGQRILQVLVHDQPLDDNKVYTLATNDYVGTGGDGYGMFKGSKVLVDKDAGGLLATQVIDYVIQRSTISPTVNGRIKRVD